MVPTPESYALVWLFFLSVALLVLGVGVIIAEIKADVQPGVWFEFCDDRCNCTPPIEYEHLAGKPSPKRTCTPVPGAKPH